VREPTDPFTATLAEMPDLIAALLRDHVPDTTGRWPSMRLPGNGHTPPRRPLPTELDGRRGSDDPHTARPVTSIALLALTHASAAVIGGILACRLARPQRRRPSIELAIDGATRQRRGRHRR